MNMDLFHCGYFLRGDYMKESRLYVLFILVAAFCWGTSGVFTKKIPSMASRLLKWALLKHLLQR